MRNKYRTTPLDIRWNIIEDLVVIIIGDAVYYCRAIPGFDGYFATACGHVISKKRKQPKVLVAHFTNKKSPYLRLSLKGRKEYLHVVIALTFLAASEVPCPNGGIRNEVNHIDGNPSNNDIDNLEIVSRSENAKHRFTLW